MISLIAISSGVFFAGCGDQGADSSLQDLALTSESNLTGEWTLISINGKSIVAEESTALKIHSELDALSGQINCGGGVEAVKVSDDGVRLLPDSSRGCFVDLPASVLANKAVVKEVLENGAQAVVDSDSILTVTSEVGKLMFAPSK